MKDAAKRDMHSDVRNSVNCRVSNAQRLAISLQGTSGSASCSHLYAFGCVWSLRMPRKAKESGVSELRVSRVSLSSLSAPCRIVGLLVAEVKNSAGYFPSNFDQSLG